MALPSQNVASPSGSVWTLQSGGVHVTADSHPVSVASDQSTISVGNRLAVVSLGLTVSTSAYTTGYVVGGKLTFPSAVDPLWFSGMIQGAEIICKSVQTCAFDLYLFTTNPNNSTWTDHAAPAIAAADLPFLDGSIPFNFPKSGLGTMTNWAIDGIGHPLLLPSVTSLYGVLVVNGTPTFGSTTDLTVVLKILKD